VSDGAWAPERRLLTVALIGLVTAAALKIIEERVR